MPSLAVVDRLLGRQHGVLATWQVVDVGIDGTTFQRFRRAHGMRRLHTGIWAALWSEPTFARRCVIECIRGRQARLITGGTGLVLHDVRRREPADIDLWVGPAFSPRARPGTKHHRGVWASDEQPTEVDGLPSVPVLRMLRDAAATSTPDRLQRDIAALDRMRLATPAQVLEDLDRRGRFPGKPKLRLAAEVSVEGLAHSEDERLGRQLLAAEAFVLHPRPLLVMSGERRVGEIDLAVCGLRYGGEIDGINHRADGAAEKDAARDRKLARLGWTIERFPTELIADHPRTFVEAVRAGVAAARARNPEAWPCDVCLAERADP